MFTEQEAGAFLDIYNITNVKRRTEILEFSGRLPVLMSWLAAPDSLEPDPLLPTSDIVERFLRWITASELRQVALLSAIPRAFNVDILKLLLENQNIENTFDWLLTMPFVQLHSDGWQYHDVVRRMMLHYQRQKSPDTYRKRHAALMGFYNNNRQKLGCSEGEQWINEQWRKETLAYTYHVLAGNYSGLL